jgi:hypothetical protein
MKTYVSLFALPALLAVAPLHAEFANGNMSAGGTVPSGWSSWIGTQPVSIVRDTAVYFSAPAALRVSGEAGSYGLAYAGLPITIRQGTLRGYARLEGNPEESRIAIQVFDAEKRQLDWKNLVVKFAPGEWVEFQESYKLPEAAVSANLVVSVRGKGSVWLDDVALTGADAPSAGKSGVDQPALTPSAAGWRTWIGKGEIILSRQPGVTASTSSALSARGATDESTGTAYFGAVPPAGSGRVSITGSTRREGIVEKGVVALVFQDAERRQLHWVNVATPGDTWTPFAHEEAIPAGTKEVFAVLTVNGTGSLQLDGLKFNWR